MLVVAFPAFVDSSLNPYNSLLYAQIQAQGQRINEFTWRRVVQLQLPDVLHVHWPERQVLAPGWKLRKIAEFALFRFYSFATRLRGGKVVWTAHNAFPHDKPRSGLNLYLWKRFLSRLDGVIYLSEESKRQIESEFPVLRRKQSVVIQHGDYLEWLAAMNVRAARDRISRESLGIPQDAKVILSFGLIRPYKGIDLLVEQFKLLDDDTHLVIAGYTSRPELREKIEQLSQGRPNIHLLLRWAEGEELAALLELSDMVVLPYRTITNSGAALLALSAQLPILGPNMGSMPELQHLVGSEWVRLFDGKISQTQLREAISWLQTPRGAPDMKPFSWPRIASETLAHYKSLTSRQLNR
jgi:glycosyltransferase involved in cell wall biosynthesis